MTTTDYPYSNAELDKAISNTANFLNTSMGLDNSEREEVFRHLKYLYDIRERRAKHVESALRSLGLSTKGENDARN